MKWDDMLDIAEKGLRTTMNSFCEIRIEEITTQKITTRQGEISSLAETGETGIVATVWDERKKYTLFLSGKRAESLPDLLEKISPTESRPPPWIDKVEDKGCRLIMKEIPDEDALFQLGEQAHMSLEGYKMGTISRCGYVRKAYMNTMGSESESFLPYSEMNLYVRGGKLDFYYSGFVHSHPSHAGDMVEGVKTYVRTICDQLQTARPVPAGSYPLVLDSVPFSVVVHEMFGHLLEYDLATKGQLSEKDYGSTIAPEFITIEDVPFIEHTLYVPFDDEGTVGKPAHLVDKGILTEFMVDRNTAHEIDQHPRGNARAETVSASPLIRSRTTVMEGGDHTFQEMLEEAGGGYYLYGVYRVLARPDGNFTLGIPLAYSISHGELGDPVMGISLSGNLYSFLSENAALGKDSLFQCNHCSKRSGGREQQVKVGTVCPVALFTAWNLRSDTP